MTDRETLLSKTRTAFYSEMLSAGVAQLFYCHVSFYDNPNSESILNLFYVEEHKDTSGCLHSLVTRVWTEADRLQIGEEGRVTRNCVVVDVSCQAVSDGPMNTVLVKQPESYRSVSDLLSEWGKI